MKFHILDKGAGKTTALIRWADMNEHGNLGRYIVVADQRRAHGVVQLADLLGCDIHFPLTVLEVGRALGGGVKELAVDNLDDILPYLLHTARPITHVTATLEPERPTP